MKHPDFLNSLTDLENEIRSFFMDATKEKKSEFREVVLSTISNRNYPNSRIVILRDFEENWSFIVYSDTRAKKVNEIKSLSYVNLLFYSKIKGIQIRINGKASIVKKNQNYWEKLSDWSKVLYSNDLKPGKKLKEDTLIEKKLNNQKSTDSYLKNFTSIKILVKNIDFLYLSRSGNIRAFFNIVRKKKNIINIKKKWINA